MGAAFDGTYDPTKVDIIIGDVPSVGLADDMIKAARMEEGWTYKTSADGRVARCRNANHMGKIDVSFLNTSPSVDRLQALAILDEETGQGVVSVFIKDRTSKAGLCHSVSCWIEKIPDFERAKEIGNITFTLICVDLQIVNSGLATAVGP